MILEDSLPIRPLVLIRRSRNLITVKVDFESVLKSMRYEIFHIFYYYAFTQIIESGISKTSAKCSCIMQINLFKSPKSARQLKNVYII